MSTSFRPDIEGLRAIAILLVIAFHARIPGFGGGFIGVDVFFVLSGYLITGLLVDEWERDARIDFARFYARRARRLLPALSLMLLATLVLGRVVFSPLEQQPFAASAVATGAYVSNLWFAHSATDYLTGNADLNPFLHTWSLGVEEQFYLVWPALIAVVALTFRRDRKALVAAMALLAAVSLALSIWLTRVSEPWAFFGSPARAWEFAAGALGSLLSRSRTPPGRMLVRIGTVGGLAAVLLASFLISRSTPFPGTAAIVPVLGTTAVLVGGAYAPQQWALRVLYTRPFQTVGRLSYSWYLWHWPLPLIAAAYFGELGAGGRIGLAVVSLGVAAAAHHFVENPIRYSKRLVASPRTSLAGAALLTVATLAAGVGLWKAAKSAASGPSQSRYAEALFDRAPVYTNGCHLNYFQTRNPECAFGDVASDTTIVLFGDSHAAQWSPALVRIATERRWRLVSLTKSGCPSADGSVFLPALDRPYPECDTWRAATMRRIEALRPTLVILSNDRTYDFGHGVGDDAAGGRALRRTVAALASSGIPTVVIADTPRLGLDVPTCLSRLAWGGAADGKRCGVERWRAIDTVAYRWDVKAVEGLPGARLIDMADAICGAATCEAEVDGIVTYRDGNHLTTRFAAHLAPVLLQRLVGGVSATGTTAP